MRKHKESILGYLLISPSLLILILLIVIPVLDALITSFQDQEGQWTFLNFLNVFHTPGMGLNIWFTLAITMISCFVVMAIGLALSVYLRFNQGWLSKFIQRIYFLSIFIPSIIATYALKTLYEEHGWLNTILINLGMQSYPHIMFSGIAIVLAQIWFHVPFTTLLLTSALQGIPNGQVESARDIGASSLTIIRSILIPQIQNISLFAFTLVFLGGFGGYTVPYLLGPNSPQMLGVVVSQTMADYVEPRQASAIAVIMFMISSLVATFYVKNMMQQKSST